MMRRSYLVAAVLVGFLCVGCGRDDNKQAGQEAPSAPPVQEQVQVQPPEQMFTQETMDKISQVAGGPILEKAEKDTGVVADKVAVKAEAARQQTGEFAAALKEESSPVMKKTGAALVVAGEKMQQAAVALSAPETVVIDNKNGKVILPHGRHGKALGCAACHGDRTPGAMGLGKEKAHALCKGCHKEKEKGPTGCAGCHEKKKTAAGVEGC